MEVLYLPPITASEQEYLESMLDPRISLVRPEGSPDGGFIDNFDYFLEMPGEKIYGLLSGAGIVVGYRLPSGPLRRAFEEGELRAVVVPFAGIPSGDRELFDSLPGLVARSCHFNAIPVAEHAVALLLALAKRVPEHHMSLRSGDWRLRYRETDSMLLHGKRALIVGMGRIGTHLGRILSGFGMEIYGIKRDVNEEDLERMKKAVPGLVSLETPDRTGELLPRADVVFLTAPGIPGTRGMIGAAELDIMKRTALLVNMSRGSLVDEEALYEALEHGRIGGAALDVWWRYPGNREERGNTFPSRHPFHDLDNVIMSPHRAGHVKERERLRLDALASILNELAGELEGER